VKVKVGDLVKCRDMTGMVICKSNEEAWDVLLSDGFIWPIYCMDLEVINENERW
jgi:hypothetical protein